MWPFLARLFEGRFSALAIACDLLFDQGQGQRALSLLVRRRGASEQFGLELNGGRRVAEAPVDLNQAGHGALVFGLALQHLFVGEFGALRVGQRGVVQLAQPAVDLRLARELDDVAAQANQGLLARRPIALFQAQLGKRLQGFGVVGVGVERGGQGGLGRVALAHFGQGRGRA